MLIKFWLEVSNEEQKRRFEARIEDPLRQWKLSPMDLPSRTRWYDYSRARDGCWRRPTRGSRRGTRSIGRQEDRAPEHHRHILTLIPYKKVSRKKVKLPNRSNKGKYDDEKTIARRRWIQIV